MYLLIMCDCHVKTMKRMAKRENEINWVMHEISCFDGKSSFGEKLWLSIRWQIRKTLHIKHRNTFSFVNYAWLSINKVKNVHNFASKAHFQAQFYLQPQPRFILTKLHLIWIYWITWTAKHSEMKFSFSQTFKHAFWHGSQASAVSGHSNDNEIFHAELNFNFLEEHHQMVFLLLLSRQ